MFTNSSRTFRSAVMAYSSRIEHRRSKVRVQYLDDHMLRQFGSSCVQLIVMQDAV